MLQRKVSLCLLLLIFLSSAYALPEDKEKVAHLGADSADLSQKNHRGIYNGHVEFIQGSTNLRAAFATTQADEKNQLTSATAKGSKDQQAHFWTETAPGKPPLHAHADTIHYYPLQHRIELIGHAKVEQGRNSLSADKINYDTQEQRVISQSHGKNRTTIIIYPEKKPT